MRCHLMPMNSQRHGNCSKSMHENKMLTVILIMKHTFEGVYVPEEFKNQDKNIMLCKAVTCLY